MWLKSMSSPPDENLNDLFHYTAVIPQKAWANIQGRTRVGIGIDETDFIELESYYDYKADLWMRQISFRWLYEWNET
jgi:hypothetical protein